MLSNAQLWKGLALAPQSHLPLGQSAISIQWRHGNEMETLDSNPVFNVHVLCIMHTTYDP